MTMSTGIGIEANPALHPDPALEREADEAAKDALSDGPVTINRMGTGVHVQRMPGAEKLEQARQQAADLLSSDDAEENVPADPEALAKEVEQLKKNQEHVMETLTEAQSGAPKEPGAGGWAKTAVKGVTGALAGAATGAALGTAVGGPVGTLVGAGVGAVTGAASDLTKAGVDYTADRIPGSQAQEMQKMYSEMTEMYKELKEGTDYGGEDIDGIR